MVRLLFLFSPARLYDGAIGPDDVMSICPAVCFCTIAAIPFRADFPVSAPMTFGISSTISMTIEAISIMANAVKDT